MEKEKAVTKTTKTFIYCKASAKRVSCTLLHIFSLIHSGLI